MAVTWEEYNAVLQTVKKFRAEVNQQKGEIRKLTREAVKHRKISDQRLAHIKRLNEEIAHLRVFAKEYEVHELPKSY